MLGPTVPVQIITPNFWHGLLYLMWAGKSVQELEAARQETAADLQRCYKKAALLQAQLSSLAASCREGADCRVQRLIAHCSNAAKACAKFTPAHRKPCSKRAIVPLTTAQ